MCWPAIAIAAVPIISSLLGGGGGRGGSSMPQYQETEADKKIKEATYAELMARGRVVKEVREGLSGQFGLKRRLNPKYKEIQDRIAELKNSGGDSNSPPAV